MGKCILSSVKITKVHGVVAILLMKNKNVLVQSAVKQELVPLKQDEHLFILISQSQRCIDIILFLNRKLPMFVW
jgi:hypothetical protein